MVSVAADGKDEHGLNWTEKKKWANFFQIVMLCLQKSWKKNYVDEICLISSSLLYRSILFNVKGTK